ncbi:type IX secretion system sortase PorU [Flavobacterium antarcticum]|uniref:type IX secretion system sortase PorU n=1 Tax=Flavobacterium antarcticum TaxID=271155 RepID=UPI0003B52521|nr:type IX secretion system sortase PorU [Flavobacterium antarcticum]
MKKIAFLFLFVSFFTNAQIKGSFVVDWKENTSYSIGEIQYSIPQFNFENYFFNEVDKSLEFRLTIPTSFDVNENSLRLSNVVYENISQIGDLSSLNLPRLISAKVRSVNARDAKFAQISFPPIIKTSSGYQRVKSFDYSIERGSSNSASTARDFNQLSNSVLANGDWYRFYVEKSGVYKISRSFLQQLGVNLNNVNPRSIKIYGNGGRMVPLSNAVDYPSDLEENAIQVIGEEDGSFDSNDYILFYAEGFDNWSEENLTHLNLYDTKSYYYVTVQGAFGKRMGQMPEINSSATPITAYDAYSFYEKDLINIVRLGRRWFGEDFNFNNERTFDFNFPNINTSSPFEIKVVAAGASLNASSFGIKINGAASGTLNFSSIAGSEAGFVLDSQILSAAATTDLSVQMTYNNNGVPSAKAYLDYISVKAKCNLSGFGKQYRFQYDAAANQIGFGEYQFTNAISIAQVWDITDLYNVTKRVNDSQNNFAFKASLGEVRKYIAVDSQDYYTPKKDSNAKVANQNLKGMIFKNAQGQFQDIDYLIITPKFLNSAAEKLANFHRTNSGMNVKVVFTEDIYAEFCSGKQDIGAIRNFVKYVYNNASTSANRVKYLNLFGAASFDFKNRIPNNTNVVPIFQALESRSAGPASFCSDDFFGLMDLNEGVNSNGSGLDIAVGRMIVANAKEADEMVNKVIDYHDIKSYGSWRNNLIFIGDDPSSEKQGDQQLQYFQNKLGDEIGTQKPFFNINKILLDSYVQEVSGGGDRYPKARTDIFEAFEKGALVFNYLGHGGEDGLADERIWEKEDGQNLANQYKYPLFITITCDFSRFDNPYKQTGGEITYLNPKGGAISMITTVRAIGQGEAQVFNPVLAKYLFGYGTNSYVSIAEALRLAKNQMNSNVVVYIGDPALFLAIPKPKVILTQVNDMPISGTFDDFKSLGVMKVAGQVVDENNTPLNNYNGALSVTIFDKNSLRSTLRNDNTDAMINDNPFTTGPTMPFIALGETIFRGNANVTGGNFEFNFVVPRDIRVPLGNGRMSFYAKKTGQRLDQTGVNTDIKVGGINENAAADTTPPTIKLYMNDESFVSGGITNESPILLALLEDENGMNTASGIGHDMIAILDGDESNPYLVTDYYETELDNYKKGRLKFPFRNLEKGLHTLTFKAWDVYNNPISAEIQFVVVGDESLTLKNVLNYPNPFVSYTQFWFTHNRPFEPLEVQVQVMTVTGKVVWTKNQIVNTEGFLSREITWDGRDDFGDKIGKGVYVYKLTVKSTLTNKKTEKFEKLVIL